MPATIATVRPAYAPVPARRRARPFRWFVLLVIVLVASLAIPQVFQFALGCALQLEVWRRGGDLRIDRIDGAIWEPVVLSHSYLTLDSATGATTRVEIARADVRFSWSSLFRRTGDSWIQRLNLRGVTGKVQIPLDRNTAPAGPPSWRSYLPLPTGTEPSLPGAIEAQQIDFVFQSGDDYIRVEEASFSASTTEAGDLGISRVTISQPWLRRTFRNVRGKSALQDGRLVLADVQLEPTVKLRSLSTAAIALARGDLDLDADFAAFDGTLRVEAATRHAGRGVVFEAGGSFGQINIAKLASFLALSDAAGGTIKDGKFTFRGPPRDLARAQASLRFDAVNFQWETRQWDSLTLGLVLMDRRVQLPQLDLRQGKNELHLTGELALPGPDQRWWQGDFNTTVDARIENLTDLSALLLPEFKYAAGRATVEGSIRGRGEEFNGQLLVSGSNITWRNAPIETLHAAVKLNGKEVQVANVELVSGDDYLRGRGLVKFAQPPVYWGELRVAVDDLQRYAAFLQKPVLPEPLAGGAIIDWTGEGSREGHSGKFLARLRKVRSIGALAQQFHPIDADLEASYGGETMQFTRFALSDEDSSFTANIAVGGKALHLQGVRFLSRGVVQLEGDALLPLDIWQKWPNVAPTLLLTEDVVSHVQLAAHHLDLAAAAELTGWKFPITGLLDGTLAADGPLTALKFGGHLSLAGSHIPLGWSGDFVDAAAGEVSFKDNAAVVEKFSAHHRFGDVQLAGEIQFPKLLDPVLKFTVRSPSANLPLFGEGTAVVGAALDLTVTGPLSAATLKGTATPAAIGLVRPLDLSPLWQAKASTFPPAFVFPGAPWSAWQLDVAAHTDTPVKVGAAGTAGGDLHLGGTGAAPIATGKVTFSQLPAVASLAGPLTIASGTIEFAPDRPRNPSIDLHVTGALEGNRFSAGVAGPLDQLIRVYDGPPPLTNDAVRDLLSGKSAGLHQNFSLEIQPPVQGDKAAPAPAPAPVQAPPK